MEEFSESLRAEFAPFASISSNQLTQLWQHYELLLRWNQRINLTRITEAKAAVHYHYCESLYLAKCLPAKNIKIADIGSGAGFPGIPVAVLRPDCAVDLIESDKRKAVFLTEAARELGLSNTRVIASRAQEVKLTYDWVISRAVDPDEVLKLNLAPRFAILGATGEKLPWGNNRALLIVSRGTE